MPHDLTSSLVVALVAIPLGGAIVVLLLGRFREFDRWLALGVTCCCLLFACVLAGTFTQARLAESPRARLKASFQPEFVPGDPGEEGATWEPSRTTKWDLVRFQRDPKQPAIAIQFYLGIDGLNVWLIVLTAFLCVLSVLVSWNSVEERVREFHAWLLFLEGCLMGAFLAFDLVLFFAFFELTLVPLFFLIGIWGGPQRRYASRKFFVFTLAGSACTLLGVLGIFLACYQSATMEPTFAIPDLVRQINTRMQRMCMNPMAFKNDIDYWQSAQFWIFTALALGFAVKVPLVPLHTWLPLAHVEAPTAGSVLLAGVMLKLGTYGFLRLCLPLVPDAYLSWGVPVLGILAAVGVIHGGLCALVQEDIKKLVAYSSISHLGLCMLGLAACNATGIAGSLFHMINHGLTTGALFLIVGMLYERYHSRRLDEYGGLLSRLGLLSGCLIVTCLASLGLPGLNGFVGECMVIFGVLDMQWTAGSLPILAMICGVGMLVGAWYLLSMVYRICFGPLREPAVGRGLALDVGARELAILAPLLALFVVLGVYPQPVLDASRKEVELVARILGDARKRAERLHQADTAPGAKRETE